MCLCDSKARSRNPSITPVALISLSQVSSRCDESRTERNQKSPTFLNTLICCLIRSSGLFELLNFRCISNPSSATLWNPYYLKVWKNDLATGKNFSYGSRSRMTSSSLWETPTAIWFFFIAQQNTYGIGLNRLSGFKSFSRVFAMLSASPFLVFNRSWIAKG